MARPVVLSLAPLRGEGYERLKEICDVVLDPFIDHVPLKLHQDDELVARIRETGATIVISEGDPVKGVTLDEPLICIGSTRGDPTNVDVPAATAKGIPVLRAPGRNADAVAEITIALLFAASRGVVGADKDVRDGQIYRDGSIPYQRFRAWELRGRTIGLVGLGAIGREVAWRAEGLGMKVISYDPFASGTTHDDLDALCAESHVVSMHAPVTPETNGMIGEAQFKAMPEGAIYVNAARAALHDHDALVAALQSGHLAAAGLDHFQHEWLDPKDPLALLPNVVLCPHIGGATYNTEANHSTIMADGITALLEGRVPDTIVNPDVLAKGH